MRAGDVGVPGGVEGLAERQLALGEEPVEGGAAVVDEDVQTAEVGGQGPHGGFQGGVGGEVGLEDAEGGGGVGELGLERSDGFFAFGGGAAAYDDLVGGGGGGEGFDGFEAEAGVSYDMFGQSWVLVVSTGVLLATGDEHDLLVGGHD